MCDQSPNTTPTAVRLGPPRYYVPVCIWWPWGFSGGPTSYQEVLEEDADREPIVVVALGQGDLDTD